MIRSTVTQNQSVRLPIGLSIWPRIPFEIDSMMCIVRTHSSNADLRKSIIKPHKSVCQLQMERWNTIKIELPISVFCLRIQEAPFILFFPEDAEGKQIDSITECVYILNRKKMRKTFKCDRKCFYGFPWFSVENFFVWLLI